VEKEPRGGFLGEWDRLTPKLKLVAAVLIILPVILYPPSIVLFLVYGISLKLRDKRNRDKENKS
jgi:hypothetical protein